MDNTYSKIVSPQELNFYLLACENNLTPKVIKYHQANNGNYLLVMDRYPEMLSNVMTDKSRFDEAHFIIERTRELVQKLHDIDILHNDLSEDNIVYDNRTQSVAIIDFGLSKFITEIKDEQISEYVDNLYEGVKYAGNPSNSIDYLLRVELGVLSFLESHIKGGRASISL